VPTVYILECRDKTLYTGWTTDLARRLKAHNAGQGAKYTRSRLPVKLVYAEMLPDQSSALKREQAIKRLSRTQKLALIAAHPAQHFKEEMMANLTTVEGIGAVFAQQLQDAGIATTDALLEQGATLAGRKAVAEKTGISDKLILEWVNRVDLSRVKGIGEEYADLLEAAGVDTVPELAQRNPDNLHTKMTAVNETRNLVRKLPTAAQVADWVAQAKDLPRIVTY